MASFQARPLSEVDPQVAEIIRREEDRRQNALELIASENHVSVATRTASASTFTNNMDAAEDLARERAKRLVGAEHANVQPHSGGLARACGQVCELRDQFPLPDA